MAKQIIVLDKLDSGRFRYVFWATVPVTRQSFYVNVNARSEYKDASASELTALQNGSIVERSGILDIDGLSIAQAQSSLITNFSAFQAFINANNPWAKYGSFYDGTNWTGGGVS